MARLNELYFSLGAVQRAEHTIDAIARVTKNMPDAPCVQTLNDEITYGFRHGSLHGAAASF